MTPPYTFNNLLRNKPHIAKYLVFIIAVLLSGCQMTTPIENSAHESVNYGRYYVWLKTLDRQQLIAEEQLQSSGGTDNSGTLKDSQGKLILIYSLPNSRLHQPYKAKRLLNDLLLSEQAVAEDNIGFTNLLRDQLNSQLNLLQKHEKLKNTLTDSNDHYNEVINKLKRQLNQTDTDLNRVNKQLNLLKKIDQRIDQQG
jgi:hypothetical protein